MMKKLRAKFIRIAMLSVALVLLVLSLIVNAANFISTNRDLNQKLNMIYENQGTQEKNKLSRRKRQLRPKNRLHHRRMTIICRLRMERNRAASLNAQGVLSTPKHRTPRAIFACALMRRAFWTAVTFRTLPL